VLQLLELSELGDCVDQDELLSELTELDVLDDSLDGSPVDQLELDGLVLLLELSDSLDGDVLLDELELVL